MLAEFDVETTILLECFKDAMSRAEVALSELFLLLGLGIVLGVEGLPVVPHAESDSLGDGGGAGEGKKGKAARSSLSLLSLLDLALHLIMGKLEALDGDATGIVEVDKVRAKVDRETNETEQASCSDSLAGARAEALVCGGGLDRVWDSGLVKVDGFRLRSDGRVLFAKGTRVVGLGRLARC